MAYFVRRQSPATGSAKVGQEFVPTSQQSAVALTAAGVIGAGHKDAPNMRGKKMLSLAPSNKDRSTFRNVK